MSPKQIVLRDPEIRIIIRRIALQIAENHTDHVELLLIGLNQRGYYLANLIKQELHDILPSLNLALQSMDMTNPLATFRATAAHILIVDDVNDTGATLEWIKKSWEGCCLPNEPTWETVWGNNVRFAVLVNNDASPTEVNYIGESINKTENPQWCVFPWEYWWKL
jgi:pyrimidine operon attenuation protein/uracil phosphoribosyltransferase